MTKKQPGTGQAASHGSVRIKLPDPRDLLRLLQLAVLHAGLKEDEAACLRLADILDGMGMGPISTPSGERQTIRQFVVAAILSTRAASK
ncbi:MAG TPA: hypothetical protein VKE94_22375 [Gemmataceae bacterium]|nr:hypothetical protein [Gemmataceae bacterium]